MTFWQVGNLVLLFNDIVFSLLILDKILWVIGWFLLITWSVFLTYLVTSAIPDILIE